ncbi:MAG: hypothetical protein J6X33_06240 [Clostridiales bacterium]|nr:hypothetical protein [Clostridiales bacterium]
MIETKNRDNAIDLMKGILVVFMTLSHFLYFTNWWDFAPYHLIHDTVNLVAFPGFMFCFGYVSWGAYINSTKNDVYWRIIKASIKVLIAYYFSGILFLLTKDMLSGINIFKLLTFQMNPFLVEFLLSFFLLDMMLMVIRVPLKKANNWSLVICGFLCLCMCFFPYKPSKLPILGCLIGMDKGFYDPIVQYFPHFLFGMVLSKEKIMFNKIVLFVVAVATIAYYVFSAIIDIPSRFPPDVLYVLGSSLFVYSLFIFCKKVELLKFKVSCVEFVGKNTLVYLVTGNFVIYTIQAGISHGVVKQEFNSANDIWKFIIVYFFCIVIASAISLIIKSIARNIVKKATIKERQYQ